MLNESIIEEEPLAFQVVSFDNVRNTYIFLVSVSYFPFPYLFLG